jgi:hypothetical protein
MTFLRTLSVLTLLLAASALHAIGQEGDSKTIHDGVFTEAQAEQGSKLWEGICGECHMDEEFVGENYMSSWTNVPVAELFDLISVTMPEDNPGSLADAEYAAVIAHMLDLNGLPAGEEELPAVYEDLQKILIQGPFQ